MKRPSFITWDQLKVGAVIVIGLLIVAAAVWQVGKATNMFAKRYKVIAFVSNASGLRVGGSVLVAGQLAGRVSEIEFLPVDYDTTRNLRVVLALDRAVQEQVRADSKARVRTLGLLGDKVVDITTGTPRYAALAPGDTLSVAQTLDYEQVLAAAATAVDDVVLLTRDLRQITGGIARGEGTVGQLVTNRALYDQFVATTARMNGVLARVQNSRGTVGRLLDDPALYNQFTQVLASTDSLVRSVGNSQGTVGRLLRDTTLYTNMVSITAGADSLVGMLTNGQGLASRLLTDQTLYDELNKLVHDLNAILADVRRDPPRYTRGMIQVKLF